MSEMEQDVEFLRAKLAEAMALIEAMKVQVAELESELAVRSKIPESVL